MREKAAERMRHEGYYAQRLEVHALSASDPIWSRRAFPAVQPHEPLREESRRALWTPATKSPKSAGVDLQHIVPITRWS